MFLLMMADTLRKVFFINAFFIKTAMKTNRVEKNYFEANARKTRKRIFLLINCFRRFSLKAEYFVRSLRTFPTQSTQRILTVKQ